jgi:hypothetical protein
MAMPMLIDDGSAMFASAPKPPLRYRWIAFPQMAEMVLEHLWISEDQRFAAQKALLIRVWVRVWLPGVAAYFFLGAIASRNISIPAFDTSMY